MFKLTVRVRDDSKLEMLDKLWHWNRLLYVGNHDSGLSRTFSSNQAHMGLSGEGFSTLSSDVSLDSSHKRVHQVG